jgi:hypothetical protein
LAWGVWFKCLTKFRIEEKIPQMRILYTLLLLLFTISNTYSLTEQEEFELYKEFKAQKAAEKSQSNNSNAVNAGGVSDEKSVKVVVNNNYSDNSDGKNIDYKKSMIMYEAAKKILGLGLVFLT